jgi:hypothetical protein
LLIPPEGTHKKEGWYVYGVLPEELPGGDADKDAQGAEDGTFPREPRDVCAPYGAIPGNPEVLARRYTQKAYIMEIFSWLILLAGVAVNILFFALIIFLLFLRPLADG